MTSDATAIADPNEARWHDVLVNGHRSLTITRFIFPRLPSPPRCKLCQAPFSGFGSRLAGLVGFSPSRKNPNMCARCCEWMPPGGANVDIAVLFADVRASTSLGEELGDAAYAALMNRFYSAATDVLVAHDAVIDKLMGDEVMALFIPGISGPDYRRRAVDAAVDLLDVTGHGDGNLGEPWLRLGIGVHAGTAFVGNVGGAVVDFTALGDTVNTASRLQSYAAPGEILVSDELWPDAGRDRAIERRQVVLRGKAAPVGVRVLRR